MLTDPVEVAKKFFEAWQHKNWSEMLQSSQLSWQTPWAKRLFAERFSNVEITRFEYVGVLRKSKVSAVTYWDLDTVENGVKVHTRAIARVFRESAPNRTDVNGEWGVNPTTVTRKNRETAGSTN